jgi:HEAT repeat protein
MPLDDLDRRLAQAVAKGSIVPAKLLGELSQRADVERRTLARCLVDALAPDPSRVLVLLRSLHAGFPAHEEDALDRHEDRLIARLALRVHLLDEESARTAIAEQDARRARGQHARLGEILLEQGKLDASTAERLYRQFENAAVVCDGCFAPNPRGGLAAGAVLECPRCGTPATVKPPAAKPGWTSVPFGSAPQSDLLLEEAGALAGSAATGGGGGADSAYAPTVRFPASAPGLGSSDATASGRKLVPQKRRRPKLAPEDRRADRKRALLTGGGALLVLVLAFVAWRAMSPSEGQLRLGRFKELAQIAHTRKADGSIEEAAQDLQSAVDLFKDVKIPAEAADLVASVKKEEAVCVDFATRTAKMNVDGDATPLCELAKTCDDKDVLRALVERLVHSKDSEATGGLVTLSANADEEIARSATQAALSKGGAAAVPLIDKLLAGEDASAAASALRALMRIEDKAALPSIEKALERYPKQDGLWLNAAQLAANMKDPAAVPLLKKLAHDDRPQVAEAAIAGLVKIAPRDAVAELVQGLDGSEPVQKAALAELEKQGEGAIPPLSAALAKGQATAALPLIAIASPRAIAAITETLPKLPWDKRGSVLEALCSGSAPAGWLSATVGTIVNEAREAVRKKDAALTRTVLQQVVAAAKAFGFPDAAGELKFELRFKELSDRSPLPINEQNLDVADADDPSSEPRLELRNYTEARLVLYALGPDRIELHAVSNTESSRVCAAGKYDVWIARVADNGSEVDPARGTLELTPGKVTAVQYGTRPDPAEEARLMAAGRAKAAEAEAGSDENESDKLKRIFDRGFRAEQLVADARKTLEQRLRDESPWKKEAESVEKTPHYRVLTDDGPNFAKKVAAELERAYDAYGKILAAPADVSSGGFVVRFFKEKAAYDAWRNRTSLAALYTEALSKDRKLPDRTRDLASRGEKADPKTAAKLLAVADCLEKSQGIDELEIESLEELDDELTRSEKVTDPALLARSLRRAFTAVSGSELLAAAAGASAHGTILGHYNHASKELCLFDVEGWERTLRHEAFHQFLFAHAAGAPNWIHEGLATYFEVMDKKGKNDERIAELRRANDQNQILDNLRLATLLATERLDSLDYAIAWSFIYYLIENEPAVLGRMLARSGEGKASAYAIFSSFDDMTKTEEAWQKATRRMVLGN